MSEIYQYYAMILARYVTFTSLFENVKRMDDLIGAARTVLLANVFVLL